MENMNGLVGNDNRSIQKHMDQNDEVIRSENGNGLIELCAETDFIIITKFG